jgi:endoglucanase
LFFVEGIDNKVCNPNPNLGAHFWGENLEGVHCHPIRVANEALQRRVVYTPHVYGPEGSNMGYFNAGDFPKNMPALWHAHFGFAQQLTGTTGQT